MQSSCPTTPLSTRPDGPCTLCVTAIHPLSSLDKRGQPMVSSNTKQQHFKESLHLQSTLYMLTPLYSTPRPESSSADLNA